MHDAIPTHHDDDLCGLFLEALPIALGIGAGAESRRPLGLAVVGGLVDPQLLTLYITPVVYLYMERLRSKFSGKDASPISSANLLEQS